MPGARHIVLGEGLATYRQGWPVKLAFLAAMYLDLVLTLIGTQNGFEELNPIMARMLSRPLELALVKIVAPAVLAWLLPARLLVPSLLVMAAVAGWNIGVMVGRV